MEARGVRRKSDHKRSPGDFGLRPPSNPRPDATLCDDAQIFKKAEAQEILEAGIDRGLVSDATGIDDFSETCLGRSG